MSAQFQYTRLAYQKRAVDSVFEVFSDVRFVAPRDVHANPTYLPHEAEDALRRNIDGFAPKTVSRPVRWRSPIP